MDAIKPIARTLFDIEAGPEVSFHNLTMLPLAPRQARAEDTPAYATLDEALALGLSHSVRFPQRPSDFAWQTAWQVDAGPESGVPTRVGAALHRRSARKILAQALLRSPSVRRSFQVMLDCAAHPFRHHLTSLHGDRDLMKALLIGTAILLFSSTATVKQQPHSEGGAPAEQVVQTQLDAYNRHDLEAFLATYAPTVRVYDHPDKLQYSGLDQMRKVYGELFTATPKVRAKVLNRISQGNHVIDHEHVTGLPDNGEIRAVAIYEVRNGRIQAVWFIR